MAESLKETCGCDCCHGESCGTCPDCLPRIYEHDHPGMADIMFGAFLTPTAEELAEWREITDKATPGPWSWNEEKWNAQLPRKNDRRQMLYCLQGAKYWGVRSPDWMDKYDYRTIMELHWYSVKGSTIVSASPIPEDREFMVLARTAMPRLLEYVAELEAELTLLKGKGY